jgi:hypothetical protein
VEQPTTHHVAGHRNPSTEISLAVRRAQIIHQHTTPTETPSGYRVALPAQQQQPRVAQQPLDRGSPLQISAEVPFPRAVAVEAEAEEVGRNS